MKKIFFLLLFIPIVLFSQNKSEQYIYFLEKGKNELEFDRQSSALRYFKSAYETDSTQSEIKLYYGLAKMREAIKFYRLKDKFYSMWSYGNELVNESKKDNSLSILADKELITEYASLVSIFGLCDYYTKEEVQDFFNNAFTEINKLESNPNFQQGISQNKKIINERYNVFRFEMKCDK
jgi:predicted nucleic acid-binding protein